MQMSINVHCPKEKNVLVKSADILNIQGAVHDLLCVQQKPFFPS